MDHSPQNQQYPFFTPINENEYFLFKCIWQLNTLNKIKHYLYKCMHNKLPTRSYLNHISMQIDSICTLCHQENESIIHIFLHWPYALHFWNDIGLNTNLLDTLNMHWMNVLRETTPPNLLYSLSWDDFLPFALWYLWTNSNNNVFNRINKPLL